MSFIKKTLASVGIGAARVDAELDVDRACPGDTITGVVHVRGGETARNIDYIGMALLTQYKQDVDDSDVHVACSLAETRVCEQFEATPGCVEALPFTLRVPWETPLSLDRTEVWLQTALSVPRALDPKDRDALRIDPTVGMATVLEALEQLGFTLRKAHCQQNRLGDRQVPFVQELKFMPGGTYTGRLTELVLIMSPGSDGVHVWLEADLRTGGLAGVLLAELDLDERFTQCYLDQATLDRGVSGVAAELGQAIDARIG